jgi:imidazolonepropionase-like amidohydrolase
VIVVEGNRIAAVNPTELPTSITEIDLGDVTLLPGLMDMELNMLIGGPETPTPGLPLPMHGVQDDPVYRTLRGTVNAKTTLLAGFTTVRNLGLMVKTDGYLLDVDLGRAIDAGFGSVPGSCLPAAMPSPRPAGTSSPQCSSASPPTSCR